MRSLTSLAFIGILALTGASCGDVSLQGRSPMLLVIDLLAGSAGNTTPGPFSNPLFSDVLTAVTSPAPCTAEAPCQVVFADLGQVVLRVVPKDISITQPTTNNTVTINRYRVVYRRADGRNTPGVDVPYGFDGAVTGTVPTSGTVTLGFEIVRHAAKHESPLVQLVQNPGIITTIAEVTFFGADQAGNDIAVTGLIQVNFGNFGL